MVRPMRSVAAALGQAGRRFLRPLDIIRAYRRGDLPADLWAGVTVGLVSIPQGIAFAAIAHLPPSAGLYSAAVAGAAGALWGSSRHLVTGPSTAGSILLFSILAPAVPHQLFWAAASLMALLVGVYRLAFALSGLGSLVNIASKAVLLGFSSGVAALITLGEVVNLLRLPFQRSTSLVSDLAAVARHLPEAHLPSLAIGAATLAAVFVLGKLSRRIPGPLLALVAASAVVAWLGASRLGVVTSGAVPRALPALSRIDFAALSEPGPFSRLVMGGLAVALLGLFEAVSIARVAAASTGERLDVSQELVGQGMANLAAGLFSGYPCSGSFNRTAVNLEAGGRTQLSSVFAGLFVLAAIFAFGPYAALLPRPAIAGLLIGAALKLVDREGIRRVFRTSRSEAGILLATFCATLLLPLEFAVLSGVLLSLALYVYRSSLPAVVPVVPDEQFRHLVERPGAPTCPQLAVTSVRGSLFFGAAQHVEDALVAALAENPGQSLLLLRMHSVNRCDISGVEALEHVVRTYRDRGGDVFLVRLRPEVRDVLERSGFLDFLGRANVLRQEEAIDWLFEERIDPAVCVYECEHRVFAECQALTKHRYADAPAAPPRPVAPARAEMCHLAVEEFEAAVEKAGADAVVLDVREPAEFRRGHLPGSRLMPLREVLQAAQSIPKDAPLFLVCRSGRRSTRAMAWLLDLGFSRVCNLKGGILSWQARGKPLAVE
jgi:SulP family sulfate permease